MITLFGRELTSIAYLVLQHPDAAADAVARGIADVWGRVDEPNLAPDVERLRVALLGATARHALRGHLTSRAVDPTTDGALSRLVSGLSPPARAAFGLQFVAGLSEDAIAPLLEISPRRMRRILGPTTRPPTSMTLATQLAALPVRVDPDRVRAALGRPADQPVSGRPWLAAAVFAFALVALRLATMSGGGQSADGAAGTPETANPRAEGRGPTTELARTEVAPFTLADCHIEPVGSPIAFAGWLTVEEIGAPSLAPPGSPVYAIVTRDQAEWIGYRYTHDRPVFPRPVGRLGCVLDPSTGKHVAVGVAQSWEPPKLADGCPGSPITSFAGYHELGGPGAFVLIDDAHRWSAADPELSFLARVAPAPPPGARVEAWLQPVGAGPRVAATVSSPPTDPGATRSLTHYVHVSGADVPEAGCWVMNIAVDGTVVGSAILPISARRAPAS